MREKVKLVSTADTGYFYTITKNKKIHQDKMEVKKYDPNDPQARRVQGIEDLGFGRRRRFGFGFLRR